ncbi:hypothetical protein A0J61_02867 [Choanephora cucurbitarum]|uniref:Vacuolar ATPase assembly protein VMA22 n=1 Tax=Choanephora cucurbitarum TaxID=101091 RepID=A0A1C7NKS3_9FUNG|nr:hypothetical protein A0J61_02867 [Choanephora cucurbitarum]
MNTYESICKELDVLTVSYFDKLNEYNQQWTQAGESLQKGFVDLAHAKYTMGPRTISRFSYDERMKALLQVEIDDQDMITKKKATEPEEIVSEKEGLKKRNKEIVSEKEGLKKRNKEPDEKEAMKLDDAKKAKKRTGDPLYWFGLFVSPSLRQSQGHFKSATELLIIQVNRVRELQQMEKRYEDLQQQKIASQLEKTTIKDEE